MHGRLLAAVAIVVGAALIAAALYVLVTSVLWRVIEMTTKARGPPAPRCSRRPDKL